MNKSEEFAKLNVWRDGDDIYLNGKWLCNLKDHGPDGDEFGYALLKRFPNEGFIDRSTKPRAVA